MEAYLYTYSVNVCSLYNALFQKWHIQNAQFYISHCLNMWDKMLPKFRVTARTCYMLILMVFRNLDEFLFGRVKSTVLNRMLNLHIKRTNCCNFSLFQSQLKVIVI